MPRKLTTEEFVEKAREVHGDKYEYSEVVYKDCNTKITIICPKHGKFEQTPHKHLTKRGCPNCKKEALKEINTLTTEKFTEKANKIHHNKYDYSKVKYFSCKEKVCIICPIHDEFWQTPDKHLQGQGCKECGKNEISKIRKLTLTEFIWKAKQIHHNKYDYHNSDYIDSHTKIKIICPTHGEYYQTPNDHLNGCGCPKCNSSHLEFEVRNFLKEQKISFEEQKQFEWLGMQSLDFYLPQYNVAIECQGKQHFESVDFFGGKKNLEIQKKRDNLKRELCETNGIKLLYYSNLGIIYPYKVFENKTFLLEEILK